MYLDCDTTPPLRSFKVRTKKLELAKGAAMLHIRDAKEGQIGIYDDYGSLKFYGYVIRYPGQEPYFEAAPAEEAA